MELKPSSTKNMEKHPCADDSSNEYRILYENHELFDEILIAEIDGDRLSAHRSVLSKWSRYFECQFRFRSQMKEAQTGVTKLKEFDGKTLKLILDFMYTVPIELCSKMAEKVLKAADFLQIRTLVDYCSDFIVLQTSDCLNMHLFSEQQNYLTLRNKTYIFVYSNFETVCTEEEFLQLNEDQLNKFILDDCRIVRSEEKLYISLVKWVEHDKPNRENSLIKLLKHIDFHRLEPEFITDHSLPRHLPSDSRTRRTNILVRVSGRKPLKIHTFNPDLDVWFAENWPLPSIRNIHLLAVVNENLIVCDQFRFECLNLETMKWTELRQMTEGLKATEMIESEGYLYVLSEDDLDDYPNFIHSTDLHKYDFSTHRWMDVFMGPSYPRFAKLAVHDGLLYSCGYNGLERYDRTTKDWTSISLGERHSFIYAVAVMDEYLYVVLNEYNPRIDRYHPSTNSWTKIGSIGHKFKRMNMRVGCVVSNKRLLVYGGHENFGCLVEYNPETNQLTSLPSSQEDVILFTIKN